MSAGTLLFTPNLLDYFFTGRKLTEFTIASTSQMMDRKKRNWSSGLLKTLDLPEEILTDIVAAGTVVGPLRTPIAREVGLKGTQWVTPAAHDTGSAVAAIPTERDDVAFISSGTWSLVGIQTPVPIVTPEVMRYNFTNEGCVGNKFRLLKNVSGLWLIQQCRKAWEQAGKTMGYEQMSQMAAEAKPLVSLVDPDADGFLNPEDMPAAIRQQCKVVGEPIPTSPAAVIRCAMDSLALKSRWVIERLEQISGRCLSCIHVVGGGIKNQLLCQLTADATGRPVIAGPVEASAIGNLLVQAMALGELSSPVEIRQVVSNSFPTVTYEPQDTSMWNDAYGRYLEILGNDTVSRCHSEGALRKAQDRLRD
jgi:rhamnulokinase